MTQRPSDESVVAPWHAQSLSWDRTTYELFRKDQEFWVRLPNPDQIAELQRRFKLATESGERAQITRQLSETEHVDRQVVMTTGAQHYQAYWVRGARGNELWQVPFVYHLQSRRFLPRRAVFLQPPDDPQHTPRWNSNCVQCHAVAGQPRHEEASDAFNTQVAELGIACEACHGPAQAHVRKQLARAPWAPWSTPPAETTPDSTIINPATLTAEASSEVCGQCHSYYLPTDPDTWWETGFVGKRPPRQPLEQARRVLSYPLATPETTSPVSASLDSIFFPDGTVRVGGREYNGLIASACYLNGQGDEQLSCLSCHLMHGSDAVAQVVPEAASNALCTGCHSTLDALGAADTTHSHHLPQSAGNQCVNCHMPFTSYALLRGLRSHRITSPNAEQTHSSQIPNACNQCHIDRPLSWTARALSRWYSQPELDLSPLPEFPQTAREALSGNAAVRALAVHSLAWGPARSVASDSYPPLILAEALGDQYFAIRFMAARGLRSFAGFEALKFDFIAPLEQRAAAQRVAQQLARSQFSAADPKLPAEANPALRTLTPSTLEFLTESRDRRPIRISE